MKTHTGIIMAYPKIVLGLSSFIFASVATQSLAAPSIALTEVLYKSNGPDIAGAKRSFAELTNVTDSPVDVSSFVFVTGSSPNQKLSLASIGVLAAHESLVVTAIDATQFRGDWSLANDIRVLSNAGFNSGKGIRYALYSSSDTTAAAVPLFDYADGRHGVTTYVAGLSTNFPLTSLGADSDKDLTGNSIVDLSTSSDAYASRTTAYNDVGNPGTYLPEPSALVLLSSPFVFLRRSRRAVVSVAA